MEPELFRIIDASGWALVEVEQLGTKEKVWLEDDAGRLWLFKQVRADRHGIRGEDWAEKLAAEMAGMLELPAAEVELGHRAFRQGEPRGVLSRYMLPDDHPLTHGNELLGGIVVGYPRSRTGAVPGYTVAVCMDVLRGFAPTPGAAVPDDADAGFLFAGYLLLDALIANTDRHHENWGVVQAADVRAYLAPSFDHGSSLGFQEPQERKLRLLDEARIAHWTNRARTKFEGQPHPVDAAADALTLLPARQATIWRERLASLDLDGWARTLARIPTERMSQLDRTFALQIVRLNHEALIRVR